MMLARPVHTFHEHRSAADAASTSQLPDATAVLEEYVAARRSLGVGEDELGEVISSLDWFLSVCYYKVVATIAVIYKRDRKRPDPDPKLEVASRHLGEVLDAGHRVLDAAESDPAQSK
jgi:hypothetical protein